MISLKVFYLTKIYWPIVMLKTHLRGLYKTVHSVLQEKFKKHCRCAYIVQPNLTNVLCEHCGGIQKHSRWR